MDGLIGADIDEDLPVTWFQEYLDTESRLWGGGREGGRGERKGGWDGERGRGREGRGERKGEGGKGREEGGGREGGSMP